MLRRYQKTEIYSLSMIDGQRTLWFSDEGKNFEILPSLGLGQRLTKTKAYVRGIEREWRTQPPGAFSNAGIRVRNKSGWFEQVPPVV